MFFRTTAFGLTFLCTASHAFFGCCWHHHHAPPSACFSAGMQADSAQDTHESSCACARVNSARSEHGLKLPINPGEREHSTCNEPQCVFTNENPKAKLSASEFNACAKLYAPPREAWIVPFSFYSSARLISQPSSQTLRTHLLNSVWLL